MADAYGALTFTKSEDAQFDRTILADALNKFQWDFHLGEWYPVSSEFEFDIFYSINRSLFPTVFPIQVEKEEIALTTIDEQAANHNNMPSVVDYCESDSSMEEATLAQLVDVVSPCLQRGWIEIGYSANCMHEFVESAEFGVIRISSDGKAHRRVITTGPCVEPLDTFEAV